MRSLPFWILFFALAELSKTLIHEKSVMVNETISLLCNSSSVHEKVPKFVWSIPMHTKYTSKISVTKFLHPYGSNMTIREITKKESGLYRCNVTSGILTTTTNFKINVFGQEENFKLFGTPKIMVRVHGTATWIITAEPPQGVRFFMPKDGRAKLQDFLNGTCQVVISDAKYSDEITYKVTGKKGLVSKEFQLKMAVVGEPIVKLGKPRNLSGTFFTPGEDLKISCRVVGEHTSVELKYESTGDSKKISYQNSTRFDTTTYQLENWSANSSGTFVCEASNQYGTAKDEIFLCISDVTSPGLYLETPDDIQENSSIKLTCMISDCAEPRGMKNISWVFNGNEISGIQEVEEWRSVSSIKSVLHIENIGIEQVGLYKCVGKLKGVVIGEKSKNLVINNPNLISAGIPLALKISLCGLILILMVISVFLFIRKRRNEHDELEDIIEMSEFTTQGDEYELLPEQAQLLPLDRNWLFPRDKLTLGKILGAGFFGEVYKGEATKIIAGEDVTTVAVKKPKNKENSDKSFVKELKIMAYIGHHAHIVNLLGVSVDKSMRETMIITEFCAFGNLADYLKKNRRRFVNKLNRTTGCLDVQTNIYLNGTPENTSPPLDTSVLTAWSYQISRGMEWLTSKQVLHGDLAARNILLTGKNTTKICDFGLARHLYSDAHYQKSGKEELPVRWMALESLKERVFSTQSDIWSYGIVLWELFTLGDAPYPDIEFDLYWRLLEGYRLPKPEYAPVALYNIMKDCWDEVPSKRPSFFDISCRTIVLMDTPVLEENVELAQCGSYNLVPYERSHDPITNQCQAQIVPSTHTGNLYVT